jgi:hypothetical protein
MAKQEPAELRALDRARQQVEAKRAAYQASIRARNAAVRAARAAGHPAADVYRRAGVSQSTYSRQGGGAGVQ